MASIATVLFDADGVIQLPPENWTDAWSDLIGDAGKAEGFLRDVFAAEEPYLVGGSGFQAAIRQVLDKWDCDKSFEDVLSVWTMIEPSEELIEIVSKVTFGGTTVGLATNQQSDRYEFMNTTLGYASNFEHHFVSFKMGVRKPSADYFKAILASLPCAANEVLFFDDNEPNVLAARSVGINAETYHLREGKDRMIELLQYYEVSGF